MGCNTSKEQVSKLVENYSVDVSAEKDKDTGDNNDEVEAATKIQAAFRGHKVRAKMKQEDSNGSSSAAKVDNTKTESEPTKEELEADFDPNDKELANAAVRIQSCFRGHMARKGMPAEGEAKEDVDLDEITKKVAEELDIDMNDPELHKAATKIQASFRGHKSRREDEK